MIVKNKDKKLKRLATIFREYRKIENMALDIDLFLYLNL